MPGITNYFKKLAGVPVHYDRPPLAQYGGRGISYKFYCDEDFQEKLEECFEEVFELSSIPKAEIILSAGAYVNKSGHHGKGRAFDLDGIIWKSRTFITTNYPTDKVFYLGIEAVLRKHFGTVLNYLYNAAHQDHFHIDDGTEVGFNASSKSRVLFVQAAITHILKNTISIDGDYGPETGIAINKALQQLDIQGIITKKEVWLQFLTKLAENAFQQERQKMEATMKPSELLANVFDLIDHHLQDHPAKKTIESAVLAFAEHEDVKGVVR